jgi:hypothetical protein
VKSNNFLKLAGSESNAEVGSENEKINIGFTTVCQLTVEAKIHTHQSGKVLKSINWSFESVFSSENQNRRQPGFDY